MTFSCIIVDDEPLAQSVIESYLKNVPNLELKGKFDNAIEALTFINSTDIDLMFLDINMPELSGMDLLKTMTKRPEVILTTAYSEYAIESYELGVSDYLLKPISLPRFLKAVTKVSYFKGKDKTRWKTDIPTYRKLNLGKVYKGINLYLKAYGKNVEKIFVVGKNGNPQDIKLKIEGAENLKVNKDGELEIVTQKGTVKFSIPVAYQDIKGKRKFVDISYSVSGNIYSFKVGKYNRNYPLIIDPMLASTFVGGGSYDYSYSIALDSNGNVFVAGETWDATDYPFTTDMKGSGGSEIVVSKFSSDMSSLLSSVIIAFSNSGI